MKPRYYVLTYDIDKEKYTPQQGVRQGPYSLFGLRKALRALQEFGYTCEYYRNNSGGHVGDPSVLVFRKD